MTHHISLVIDSFLHVMLLFLNIWASFYGISVTALNHLIGFLRYVFLTMATKSFPALATAFPTSLYLFQKHFGSNIDKFEKDESVADFTVTRNVLKLVNVQKYAITFNTVIIPMNYTQCLVGKNL